MKQLCKLLGMQTVHSPNNVTQVPSGGEGDEFEHKVNQFATCFMNETIKIAVLHLEHCCSMRICESDVQYAIEQFTKRHAKRVPWTSCNTQIEASSSDEDSEWESDEDDHEAEDEADYAAVEANDCNEMDCELDQEYFDVDESDFECRMDCENNEEAWITKPAQYPTPLFDSMFPTLTENDKYFKLSDNKFVSLAKEVMLSDLNFYDDSQKLLKDAMFRYIVECFRP